MSAAMGAGEGETGNDEAIADEAIGMDMMRFLMETPLLSILHFQESSLPMPADELVDGLLAQVHNQQTS